MVMLSHLRPGLQVTSAASLAWPGVAARPPAGPVRGGRSAAAAPPLSDSESGPSLSESGQLADLPVDKITD